MLVQHWNDYESRIDDAAGDERVHGVEEEDDNGANGGRESERELRGGEEVEGSVRGLQEVDVGDDNGEADVRGQRFGGAFAVFFDSQLSPAPRGYCGGLLRDLGSFVS